MNEKPTWTGIAPSPAVLAKLDYEEMATLALLCWSTAANQPVTAADVAALEDRDEKPLGIEEACDIVKGLANRKIVSVFGMRNDRPLSVRVGGFRPRTPRNFSGERRSAPYSPASSAPTRIDRPRNKTTGPRKQGGTPPWILKEHRVETGLEVGPSTPPYVGGEAAQLRSEQIAIEGGKHGNDLVGAAMARLGVLLRRIALYERWLKDEPGHPKLAGILEKKRKAVPEMEFQIERAKAKQKETGEGEARAS